MNAFCHIIVARGDNLGLFLAKMGYIAKGLKNTSMISSRGNSSFGMSAALQAIK